MNINLISKYRTELMGISVLWVMFFHMHSRITVHPLLTFFQDIGYGGVDFFYLLSGLGVYHAYKGNAIDFYKRRISRILPYYIPIVIIFSVYMYKINYISGEVVLTNIFLLSYWFNLPGTFDWYIPGLLFLYLITPLYLEYFKRYKNILFCIILILTGISYFLFVGTPLNHLLIVFLRFPMYFGGIWLGYMIKERNGLELNWKAIGLCALSLLAGIGFLYYFFKFDPLFRTYFSETMIPFWFIAFPFCLFTAFMCSKIKMSLVHRVFLFFGNYSLLIYIIHVKMIEVMLFYIDKYVDLYAVIATILFSVIWKYTVDRIKSRFIA